MSYDKLHIDLIRSKDDEPLESKKYQTELIEFSKFGLYAQTAEIFEKPH